MTTFSPLEQMRELEYCQNILSVFGVNIKIPVILSRDRSSEVVFSRALVVAILFNKGFRPSKISWIVNKDKSNVCRLLNQYERRKDAMVLRFKELRPQVFTYMNQKGNEAKIKILEEAILELRKQA